MADSKEITVDHKSILLKTMKDIEHREMFFYCKNYPDTTIFFFLKMILQKSW